MQLTIQDLNSKIYTLRGVKVMLDSDLAKLYEVETKVLNQAVKRNIERFPDDFMFQLTNKELDNLRSQIVTTKFTKTRTTPFAFTEQGIAMLSSVLRSKIAINVNIQIMRTFVAMRRYALTHEELAKKIDSLEKRVSNGEEVDRQILEVLNELIRGDEKGSKKIGYI